jgi:hypothetical protein
MGRYVHTYLFSNTLQSISDTLYGITAKYQPQGRIAAMP